MTSTLLTISNPNLTHFLITETCRCPGVFYTNWAVLPPYVTKSIDSQSPQGIIGTFVEEMLSESCGVCKSHGHTSLNFKTNGKGDTAYKTTMNEVILDVNSKTAISFPVTGAMDNDKFQRYYVFVPMVESPGIAFITVRQKDGSKNRVISTLLKYLPLYLFCLMTAYVAGTIIWALVSGTGLVLSLFMWLSSSTSQVKVKPFIVSYLQMEIACPLFFLKKKYCQVVLYSQADTPGQS